MYETQCQDGDLLDEIIELDGEQVNSRPKNLVMHIIENLFKPFINFHFLRFMRDFYDLNFVL